MSCENCTPPKDVEGPKPGDPCKDIKETSEGKNYIIAGLVVVILGFIGFSYDSYLDKQENKLVSKMQTACQHGGFERYNSKVSCHYDTYEISEAGLISIKLDQLSDRMNRLETYSK